MKILEPKYAARTTARARLDYAAEAVTRARRLEVAASDLVHELNKRSEAAEAHNAAELAVLIASGGPTVELPAMVDEGLAALAAARRDHSVKAKALAQLEAIHAERMVAQMVFMQRGPSWVSLR